MNGNTHLYGICNVAFFGTRPEGSETYYADRADRDAALDALLTRAIDAGLSATAARAGIYPVRSTLAGVRRARAAAPRHVRVVDALADLV